MLAPAGILGDPVRGMREHSNEGIETSLVDC